VPNNGSHLCAFLFQAMRINSLDVMHKYHAEDVDWILTALLGFLLALFCLSQSTFLDGNTSEENATEYGHMHLFQVLMYMRQS
jgi:hypothetical protein